jgi:hypothetical protein
MKISVSIRKTIQEDPYEPFSVELSLEKTLPENYKDNQIMTAQEDISLLLQETIDNIIKERKR